MFLNYGYKTKNCKFYDDTLSQILFYRYLKYDKYNNSELAIFFLNTKNLTIDTLVTTKTIRVEWWEYPILFKSNWVTNEFSFLSASKYIPKQGKNAHDTIWFKLKFSATLD